MKNKTYPKIEKMCLAIQEHEGWYAGSRSFRNNNPGNLRFVGQAKAKGADKANFAIFATYEDGLDTLRQMIIRACTGQSTVYKPTMTITQYFNVYAPSFENDSIAYAQIVAKKIGVAVTTPIKDLLV